MEDNSLLLLPVTPLSCSPSSTMDLEVPALLMTNVAVSGSP